MIHISDFLIYYPMAAPIIIGILLYWGLAKPNMLRLPLIAAATCWVAAWIMAFILSLIRGWGGFGVVIQALYGGILAIIGAVVLLAMLQGRRKLAALVLVVYPATLLGALPLARPYGSEVAQERNAGIVIDALESYRARTGTYPNKLDELVPSELDRLPEQTTLWGWVYARQGDRFWLAYVDDVDSWYNWVCIYTRDDRESECGPDSGSDNNSPFILPPTPFPDWEPGTAMPTPYPIVRTATPTP